MNSVRKYFVKESWIFNLESMYGRLKCIEIDLDEGTKKFPFEVANTQINDYDDLYNLIEECNNLEWTAKSGRVTGKEYGRIKEIVNWRVGARYMDCLNNGMNEADAGKCFSDL